MTKKAFGVIKAIDKRELMSNAMELSFILLLLYCAITRNSGFMFIAICVFTAAFIISLLYAFLVKMGENACGIEENNKRDDAVKRGNREGGNER